MNIFQKNAECLTFYFCVSVHRSISQIKHQLDATLCRFYFCRVTCVRGCRASFLILLMMGAWRSKHVEWLCRNKTCTVLHQVGVLFDLYYDARKHKSKMLNTQRFSGKYSFMWSRRTIRAIKRQMSDAVLTFTYNFVFQISADSQMVSLLHVLRLHMLYSARYILCSSQ